MVGRYDLKHIDKGVIYLPINNDMSEEDVDKIIQDNLCYGKTIVLLRSGKSNIKNILSELIKTRLTA